MVLFRSFIQRIIALSYSLVLILSFSCCSKSGIIEGGSYVSEKEGQIHAFYLYDFITKEEVHKHALSLNPNSDEQITIYYFSHNSNIPSQNLRLSKNIKDAKRVIKKYAFNIKYAFENNSEDEIKFIDCLAYPDDELCSHVNQQDNTK